MQASYSMLPFLFTNVMENVLICALESMCRLLLFLLVPVLLLACSDKIERARNIEIVMKSSQSYTYDITGKTYTIHNWDRPDTTIKFQLSEEEWNSIVDKYYKWKIDQLTEICKETGNVYIKDKCSDMPKLFTVLTIKTKSYLQVIKIDDTCEDFYLRNFRQAWRVNRFIEFIRTIIHDKPEIKAAPLSDIWYI